MQKIRVALILATLAVASSAALAAPKPPLSVRVYVIDCGVLDIPDTSPYRLTKEDVITT